MFGNNYGGFNNGFGSGINPTQPLNLNWNPSYQNSHSSGNFYYINGIEGAKAFLVQPNSMVVLFDSDSDTFFVKMANNQGQATLKEFEFKEKTPTPPKALNDDFVSRKEFEELKAQLSSLRVNQTPTQKQLVAKNNNNEGVVGK